MKFEQVSPSTAGLVRSILAPIESLLRTTNNLALSLEEVSETVLDVSKLTHEIAALSLTNKRNELLAERTMLPIT